MQSRTHTCVELRAADAGKRVKICGWMENVREVSGALAFIVVRDFYGTTQVVAEAEEMVHTFKGITRESTISVEGTVRERASKSPNMPTGDIEIVPDKVEVLGKCQYNELPFQINRSRDADESTHLKYRYLDLRNPEVKANVILRSNVIAALHKSMIDHGFMEITTPHTHGVLPRGRARLPCAGAQPPRQTLSAAPGSPAVQATADGERLRPLLPDSPLLPRRGRARTAPLASSIRSIWTSCPPLNRDTAKLQFSNSSKKALFATVSVHTSASITP